MRSSAVKQLGLVLLAALLLRLGAGWWLDHRWEGRFAFGDSDGYWVLARAIAHGAPYQYGSEDARIFRAPGYPLLLAPVFVLAGDAPSTMWGRALSALFGTLAVLGVWWLGRRLFGDRAGLVAATIAACYPGAVALSAVVLSEAPFCPLMLAHLGLWTAAWTAPSTKVAGLLSLAAGLAAGAAALVRPSWLLFTPLALLVGLSFGPRRARHLAIGLVMCLGLSAAMAPWWIRNARVTGHFVATTLQVGASLYDGLNPAARGASDMHFVKQFTDAARQRFDAREDSPETFEYYLDQQFRAAAGAWARSDPGRVAQLAGIKLLRTWNVWPNEPTFSSWPVRLVVLVTYVPVLVLGLIGAAKTIHGGWPYVLCWLPAVYFTLLHVVFVSSIRYREPAMLGLIVLAGGIVASGRMQKSECRMQK